MYIASEKKYFLKKGFTLIELIFVVAFVALFANLVLPKVLYARDRAKAAYTLRQIRQLETAMRLLANEEKAATWYPESAFPGTYTPGGIWNTPEFQLMAQDTTRLGKFLPPTFSAYGPEKIPFMYDNDGDTRNAQLCPDTTGVNILTVTSAQVALAMNRMVDNDTDNLACGRVTWNALATGGGALLYSIGKNQTIE